MVCKPCWFKETNARYKLFRENNKPPLTVNSCMVGGHGFGPVWIHMKALWLPVAWHASWMLERTPTLGARECSTHELLKKKAPPPRERGCQRPCTWCPQPMSDPFPLPTNYRADVQLVLSKGMMTREAKKSFLSSVGAHMLGYKRYPTGEEYTRVAIAIIVKYPFLKPPTGSPTVRLVAFTVKF